MAPKTAAFTFPDLNTEAGALTALFLAENQKPLQFTPAGYEAAKAEIQRSMITMGNVITNRLLSASATVAWYSSAKKPPTSIFDIIGASGQFEGFQRTSTGVKITSAIREQIEDIIKFANQKGKYQAACQDFITLAQGIAQTTGTDPFEDFGGSFGWRTNKFADAGGFFKRIPVESGGVIRNNKFYTLAGVDLTFVIDATGSMVDDLETLQKTTADIIKKTFQRAPNSRFSVVIYRDPQETETILPFTKTVAGKGKDLLLTPASGSIAQYSKDLIIEETQNAINGIFAYGGGDPEEGVYSGLLHALKPKENGLGNWRAAPIERSIVLIGDAEAKDKDLKPQVDQLINQNNIQLDERITPETRSGGRSLKQTALAALRESTVTVPAKQTHIYTIAIGDDERAIANFQEIAQAGYGAAFTATDATNLADVLLQVSEASTFATAKAPAPINFRQGESGLRLKGTKRSETLKGSRDNDTLKALNGNDQIKSGAGNDQGDGGNGKDKLLGEDGSDLLLGRNGNDSLLGGKADDVVVGGLGSDTATGGSGADLFVFNAFAEGGDVITDFDPAADLIDVRKIFANPGFSDATSFAGFRQLVQFVQVGADTEVRVDSDGSGSNTALSTLVTLRNVAVDALGGFNFVVA